jgi:hypothetical protein
MKAKHVARIVLICSAAVIGLAFTGSELAAQTNQFNGTYAGTQTLTESSSDLNYSQCLRGPFKRKLIVKDGAVSYTFNPTSEAAVTGTVSSAGDVVAGASEPGGGARLSGRIDGNNFTGEIWSLYCTYALQLKRVP